MWWEGEERRLTGCAEVTDTAAGRRQAEVVDAALSWGNVAQLPHYPTEKGSCRALINVRFSSLRTSSCYTGCAQKQV